MLQHVWPESCKVVGPEPAARPSWLYKGDAGVEQGEEEQTKLIKGLHKAKTDKFMDLIADGTLQLRPGVKNLIGVHGS